MRRGRKRGRGESRETAHDPPPLTLPPPPSPPTSLLALYRAVLRSHRTLPPPLRSLGDKTVRAEWAAMAASARGDRAGVPPPTEDAWRVFAGEWERYATALTTPGAARGNPLTPDAVAGMSEDQLRALEAIRAEAEAARDALFGSKGGGKT